MSEFTWIDELCIKLVELRHDPNTELRFHEYKSSAHQIKKLQGEIGVSLGDNHNSSDAKNKYNYLIGEFRKHHVVAKSSREGKIRWRFY